VIPEKTQKKILLTEETINFPAQFLSLRSKYYSRWENLPMLPYSNLYGAVSSLTEEVEKPPSSAGSTSPRRTLPRRKTDRPPGALILAEGLKHLRMEVMFVSDQYTLRSLKAGLDILGLSEIIIVDFCPRLL
jgi:hypothetical protein